MRSTTHFRDTNKDQSTKTQDPSHSSFKPQIYESSHVTPLEKYHSSGKVISLCKQTICSSALRRRCCVSMRLRRFSRMRLIGATALLFGSSRYAPIVESRIGLANLRRCHRSSITAPTLLPSLVFLAPSLFFLLRFGLPQRSIALPGTPGNG